MTTMYTPASRNHFLKVASGKSDHATLSKANARKKARAEFCATKLCHWNEREKRIAIAARIRSEKIVRSSGFPCSKAWVALPTESPSHIVGGRDPRKNIQITGTHNTAEVCLSLAGSKTKSNSKSVNQIARASVGAMERLGYRLLVIGYRQ
jgi:hypothetical protein